MSRWDNFQADFNEWVTINLDWLEPLWWIFWYSVILMTAWFITKGVSCTRS